MFLTLAMPVEFACYCKFSTRLINFLILYFNQWCSGAQARLDLSRHFYFYSIAGQTHLDTFLHQTNVLFNCTAMLGTRKLNAITLLVYLASWAIFALVFVLDHNGGLQSLSIPFLLLLNTVHPDAHLPCKRCIANASHIEEPRNFLIYHYTTDFNILHNLLFLNRNFI